MSRFHLVSPNRMVCQQCVLAAKKANSILFCIKSVQQIRAGERGTLVRCIWSAGSRSGPLRYWRAWNICPLGKGWEKWNCLAWRGESSGRAGKSHQCISICEGRVQIRQTQALLSGGLQHEAMGTSWNTGGSPWTLENTFSWWGWLSTGTVCPGRFGVTTLGDFQKASGHIPGSRKHCLSWGPGPDNLQTFLPI